MTGRYFALSFYLACCVAAQSASVLAANKPKPKYVEPTFVKIYMNDYHQHLGQLVRETPTEIELARLDGTHITAPKSEITRIRKNVGQQDAIEAFGIVDYLAWQFRRALPWADGRITKVDGSTAEISLGTKNGIKVGDELQAWKTEVKRRAVTQRVGDRHSSRAFDLKVEEVSETSCKAKRIGGERFSEGDIGLNITPRDAKATLAWVAELDTSNSPVEIKRLDDSLCLGLFGRNHLASAGDMFKVSSKQLEKLNVSPSQAFDPAVAQKLGHELGAFAVLATKVTPTKIGSDVTLRLIKTESGQILIEAKQQLSGEPFVKDAAPSEVLTPEQKAAGWRFLFNGKDIHDWRTLDKSEPRNWIVADGCLLHVHSGIDHVVYTKEQFENFELSLDWKSDGNSGVFVRTSNLGDIVNTGLEVQIETTREKLPKYSAGALYSLIGPPKGVRMKEGQWNHYDIVCDGPKISCKLNGVETFHINLDEPFWQEKHGKFSTPFAKLPRKGYIILQDHRDPVAFKNVKIRPLPDSKP